MVGELQKTELENFVFETYLDDDQFLFQHVGYKYKNYYPIVIGQLKADKNTNQIIFKSVPIHYCKIRRRYNPIWREVPMSGGRFNLLINLTNIKFVEDTVVRIAEKFLDQLIPEPYSPEEEE